ncbi:NADPH-dependent FMN reductase, partial [Pseudomonas sp.]|uniref:NADPH-dependent FMN reductase n=3 Tax=Pseudomonas TaxID=286 RepID=UPI003FD8F201
MYDDHIPQLDVELVELPSADKLGIELKSTHKPRILLLYGSTRERSFSRLLVEEAARLLQRMGAE